MMPKLTRVAGFEWGTGFYINPTAPEEAAEVLRKAKICRRATGCVQRRCGARAPCVKLTCVWYVNGLQSGNNSVVECDLAKVEVAGSNPVSRSNFYIRLATLASSNASFGSTALARRTLLSGPSRSLTDRVHGSVRL